MSYLDYCGLVAKAYRRMEEMGKMLVGWYDQTAGYYEDCVVVDKKPSPDYWVRIDYETAMKDHYSQEALLIFGFRDARDTEIDDRAK